MLQCINYFATCTACAAKFSLALIMFMYVHIVIDVSTFFLTILDGVFDKKSEKWETSGPKRGKQLKCCNE